MEHLVITPSVFNIRAFVTSLGKRFCNFCDHIGGVSWLAARTFRGIFRYKLDIGELIRQFAAIGNRSLMIVVLIAIFTGMVIALQLCIGLGRYGLKLNVGQIVGLAIFRELGPVLTCLMVAARVGSGIAAELGSMVVTEQVLAIEAMGANPVAKLVVPRVIATVVACPILTVIADVIGSFGGMIITVREAGVSAHFYLDQIRNTVLMEDYMSGLYKALFFGFAIAIISCYEGLNTIGGTEGVGRSTTRAVVFSSIVIFISDFFLTKLLVFL
jgi:phospholipid/cholesterol/gamma-HCH transport system permease protein